MLIDIEVNMTLQQAVRRLESGVRQRSRRTLAERVGPHLEGEVSADSVVLFRRRGLSTWYGRFRGRFQGDGSKVRLTGRFIRSSGIFMSLWAGFAILWGLVLAGVVLVRWQFPDSIAWLVAAVLAISIGIVTFWFRVRNARAEAELLRSEIVDILRNHGA